jgi:iron-sulfur cluster repair protein YtfE (RIC family)
MPTSIRKTQAKAKKIINAANTEEDLSKASITLLWSYLFERIEKAVTDEDYDDLIQIAQKLSTTTGNLHRIYLKLKEDSNKLVNNKPHELSEEDLSRIEKELKLL